MFFIASDSIRVTSRHRGLRRRGRARRDNGCPDHDRVRRAPDRVLPTAAVTLHALPAATVPVTTEDDALLPTAARH